MGSRTTESRHNRSCARLLCAAATLGPASATAAQSIEDVRAGLLSVRQLDPSNDQTAVEVTIEAGSTLFSLRRQNRGDLNVGFGTGADLTSGVMIPAIRDRARSNLDQGNAGGNGGGDLFATIASSRPSSDTSLFVSAFGSPSGQEMNADVGVAFFPFDRGFIGGHAINSTNNGPIVSLVAPPQIRLGHEFIDDPQTRGVYRLDLRGIGANGDNGVLIVAGGKNEDNFALSRSSGDGRYTIDIHDNGTDGETGENDPAAFVYLPYETEGLVAGRVSETSGRRPVVLSGTGAFSVSSVASGSVLLRIDGVTDDTAGVLLLTPEGGGSRNRDNIVVSSWDAAAGGFVLESRDIPSMTLEGLAGEPMFGFAYIPITPGPGFDPRPNTSTIVALPDTQLYAQNTPAIFTRQLEWIDDAAEPLRIPFVLHLGDITNRNNDPQWAVADAAFAQIDGRVPYVLAQGNHDAGPNGNADDRSTLMNQYFPLSRVGRERSFGGTFEPGRVENSFSMFEAANRRWLVLSLEWGPRDAVLAWANQVIADHPDHLAILITHAYMYNDDTRMDRLVRQTGGSPYSYGTASQPGGTNDGGDIWRGVVSQHPSVAMVLSGHIKGEGRLSSPTTLGGVAHQMLSDYQGDLEGGQGYLRLLEVTPDSNVVRVRTYSPWVDRWFTSPGAHFEIELRGETAARALIEPLDLAAPLGEIDIFDLITFLERFDAGDAIADRSPPYGVLDQADLQTFLDGFASP